MEISNNTLIKKSDDLLEAPMEDSLALMSIEEGKYFGMNPIAKFIWEQLKEPIQFNDLLTQLLQKYSVENEVCKVETLSFLNELIKRKMITLKEN